MDAGTGALVGAGITAGGALLGGLMSSSAQEEQLAQSLAFQREKMAQDAALARRQEMLQGLMGAQNARQQALSALMSSIRRG
jgi:hypothetical protein